MRPRQVKSLGTQMGRNVTIKKSTVIPSTQLIAGWSMIKAMQS
jgi:hypothetical protein